MKNRPIGRLIRHEARTFLFLHYRDSLFLSGVLLLLCVGFSSVYRVLYDTVNEFFPLEARKIVNELLFFGLFLLVSPIFGGVLSGFSRIKHADMGRGEPGMRNAVGFSAYFRCDLARRSCRMAACFLYALYRAAKGVSDAMILAKSASPSGLSDTISGSVLSFCFGAGALLLYAAIGFFAVCVLCVLLSGKLVSEPFAFCFARTVRCMAPVSGALFSGLLPFVFFGFLSYISCGVLLLFFCLPYFLYYLHFFGVFADCRRFAALPKKTTSSAAVQFE